MLALPRVVQARDRHQTAALAQPKRRARLPLAPVAGEIAIEAAEQHAHVLPHALGWRRIGPDADHTARRVAEQRRRRAAQHLDPVGLPQLQVRELPRAVGQSLRNAVHQHLDAPHGELRARPEAADRDTLIERKVVAVRGVHAGDRHERLIEAPGGPRPADVGLVDELDRLRDPIEGRVGAGHGDHGRGQRVDPQTLRRLRRTRGRVALLGRPRN